MNKTIKLALIAVVAVAIGAAIYFSISIIGKGGNTKIIASPFEQIVEQQVKNGIEGKDYASAAAVFDAVLADIQTEASIVKTDGSPQLPASEANNCRKMAFYAFEPIFESHQASYFRRTSWDDGPLATLKNRAQQLLNMKIAEGRAKQTLQQVVSNVDDYHAAWRLVHKADSCTTMAAVDSISKGVQRYKRSPLTNNASLNAGLNSAPGTAKTALATNIKTQCQRVADNYDNYSDYASFLKAKKSASKRIDEYESAFGDAGVFSKEKKALREADDKALDYYP